MKQTKTVWDGEKFTEISDAQMPEFIVAYRKRADQRAKVYRRFAELEGLAFFVIPVCVLFQWCGTHWFCAPDNDWFAFGQNYAFCVLPVCVMLLGVAKAWYDARPYLPE